MLPLEFKRDNSIGNAVKQHQTKAVEFNVEESGLGRGPGLEVIFPHP